ncbi:MAG: hypothetical protein ACRDQ5_08695 [Sciscionella sp.]
MRARGRALTRFAGAAIGLGTALALVGCGAGQITQTDTQVGSVNGANGNAGRIAVRNAQLAFPDNPDGYYRRGERVPLEVYIANSGQTTDTLTAVRSPAAAGGEISGRTTVLAMTALRAMTPRDAATLEPSTSAGAPAEPGTSASGSSQESSSAQEKSSSAAESGAARPSTSSGGNGSRVDNLPVWRVSIVLTGLNRDVRSGQTIPVTFSFAKAGQVRLVVPVGNPPFSKE